MKIQYPEELPISSHAEEIIEAIRSKDVVIIEGETGSGKSTQIPKMILQALGEEKNIACTQPRRIAAISIATRIAEECEVTLGFNIGYKIRFDDQTQLTTKITICTDGILLQEVKFDVLLSQYDAIFIDEAHERSLRIDFLMGLLKDIQIKRLTQALKPLKIIIASATLDAKKFADFFHDQKTAISVTGFSVSGRVFPVEVEYHPLTEDEDMYSKIIDLVHSIHTSKKQAASASTSDTGAIGSVGTSSSNTSTGDILIFLPGEKEILEVMNGLKDLHLPDLQCLPLYSRLPMEEQTRIFHPHPNKRHVIVSTNIAETSLTVPGITVVIDSGFARTTDFDIYSGIGSLTVQEISQASAIQRAGRAGRIEPGKCYRLYTEKNFKRRELYTRPEIQRSDLADVVLQMLLMKIPNIHTFKFIDPPNHESFEQALQTLFTLGAINRQEELTNVGLKMAHLPLDPKISRMLLMAEEYDCVAEVAIIAAFLSLKDPFIRPFGDEETADKFRSSYQRAGMYPLSFPKKTASGKSNRQLRRKLAKAGTRPYYSDLLTYLEVWKAVFSIADQPGQELYCKNNYLDFLTLEKAKEIFQQLTESLIQFYGHEFKPHLEKLNAMLDPEHLKKMENPDVIGILKSISSGLVQNFCKRNNFGNYTSARADRIFIHPGSLFYNRHPQYIIATEIVATSKLFARNITEVAPEWFPQYFPQKTSQPKHRKKKHSKQNRKSRKRH